MRIIVENKKHFTKMFDDLSSAYDNLGRTINENTEVIEKSLASELQFQSPLGTASVLEEMMIVKQKKLTEAQQVNPLPKSTKIALR